MPNNMASPGLMQYLMDQSKEQAPVDQTSGDKSFMPGPGDERGGLMAMLPLILGSVAGAVGGPGSAAGNAGSGFVGGYVNQMLKQQEIERNKKNAFETMMQKSAWDAFRELDGVDLNSADIDPSLRQMIMEYSQKFKEAIANDNYISPKEAQMLTALHAGIAPAIGKIKQEQAAGNTARSTQMGERAGLMQGLEQAYPSGPAATNDRSFSQMLSQHPDVQPAMDIVGGVDFGNVGNVGPNHMDEMRSKLADIIQQADIQGKMAKGSMIMTPYGYMKPGEAMRGDIQLKGIESRERSARERSRAMVDIAFQRLEAMGKRVDARTASMINGRFDKIALAATNDLRPNESIEQAMARTAASYPDLELPGGERVPMAQLMEEHGMSMAPPPNQQQIAALKLRMADALAKGVPMSPQDQELARSLPAETFSDVFGKYNNR